MSSIIAVHLAPLYHTQINYGYTLSHFKLTKRLLQFFRSIFLLADLYLSIN